ncbi:MAG: InlB B-repeat-containing protein [Oscillospiraceae bacterium]|jgi:uncharacterized repeat protein (TIGR02543 family)|nr:InlB B-repeat-containing protein [Oscillospiraceae bacterium]
METTTPTHDFTSTPSTLKKAFSALLALLLVAGVFFVVPVSVFADSDDTLSGASTYTLGTTVNGIIAENEERDHYKFTLSSSGRITLKGTFYTERVTLKLYDDSGSEVSRDYVNWNATTKRADISGQTWDLNAGTYYFCVEKRSDKTGSYNFSISFNSAWESFLETNFSGNNSYDTANPIVLGTTYNGLIACHLDSADFYKFTLTTSGRIALKGTFYTEQVALKLYDDSGSEVSRDYVYWNATTKRADVSGQIWDLNAGTYYFCVEKRSDKTGSYDFNIAFNSAWESFKETNFSGNNSYDTANPILLRTTYNGLIACHLDDADFYKFTLPTSGRITLKGTFYTERVTLKLYDDSGSEVSRDYVNWNATTKRADISSQTWDLNAGTYYFCVEKRSDKTGSYSFTLSKEFTVNFNANGGTAVAAKNIAQNTAIGTLPSSTRTGYTFKGWYTAKTGGTKINKDTKVTKNITYYAQWTAKKFTVTYSANGGKIGTATSAKKSVTYASKYVLPTAPKRTGYKFAGWYTAKTGGTKVTASTVVKLSKNQTLYAHWTANKYTVTFNANGGSAVKAKSISYNTAVGALPTPTRKGYKFSGWYTAKSGGTKIAKTQKITKAVTYYAHWAKKK